jgi:HAD domain in Swiss Army Knife RNA repair proteins
MGVIFLDIDGVLNRTTRISTDRCRVVDADLLNRLKDLVSKTGAKLVLTSTWRHDQKGLQSARDLGIPFDDVAPDLRPQSRGAEVNMWLRTHSAIAAGRFAVLDDDDDGYGKLPLFQTDPTQGLTPEVATALSDYLMGHRTRDLRRSRFVRCCQWLRSLVAGHRG